MFSPVNSSPERNMCRRFLLLSRLSDATNEEILAFLRGVVRLYFVLILLNFISLITTYMYMQELDFVMQILEFVNSCFSALSILVLINFPRPNIVVFPAITIAVNSAFTIYNAAMAFIYVNNVVSKSVDTVISIYSLLITCTTLVILRELRHKLQTSKLQDALIKDPSYTFNNDLA